MGELTVAVLGTGIMGAGMARSLRRAGIDVRAWNRTRERAEPLAGDGVVVADTARQAAEGADVLLTMLFGADSVAAALADVAAPEGTPWLQMSTVGVEGAGQLAELGRDKGWVYVDAPVLGTRAPAEQGTLTILASGPEEVREECAPVFDAIGGRTLWLGAAGQGSRLKMVVNSWVLTITAGTGQAVALAQGLGLDPQAFLDAIDGSAIDSPYARVKAAAMLSGDFTPSFTTSGAAKDLGLIAEAARSAGVEDALAEALQALFTRAVETGHGEEDMASVVTAFTAG